LAIQRAHKFGLRLAAARNIRLDQSLAFELVEIRRIGKKRLQLDILYGDGFGELQNGLLRIHCDARNPGAVIEVHLREIDIQYGIAQIQREGACADLDVANKKLLDREIELRVHRFQNFKVNGRRIPFLCGSGFIGYCAATACSLALLRRQVGVEIEGLKRQLAVDVAHLAAEIDAEIADALDGVKRNLRVGETVFRIIDTECPADGEGAKAGAFHFKRGAGPGSKLAN